MGASVCLDLFHCCAERSSLGFKLLFLYDLFMIIVTLTLTTPQLVFFIEAYAREFGVSLNECSPAPCPFTKNKILAELVDVKCEQLNHFFKNLHKTEQEWLKYKLSMTHAEVSTWPLDSSINYEYGSYGKISAVFGLLPQPLGVYRHLVS